MIRPRFNRGSVQTIGRGGTTFILADDPSLTLDLQFANDRAFTTRRGPLPTFTRPLATATFVGSNGLIQSAGADVPRINYNPATLECLGLLLEEQRTNLTIRSDDFANAAWAKTAVTATADQTTSPDGSVNADLISETTANSSRSVFANTFPAVTSGTSYALSVFLKKGTGSTAPDWVILGFVVGGFGTVRAAFNLSTGLFGSTVGTFSGSVTQYPDGWWRVSMTATAIATAAAGSLILYLSNNTNTTTPPTYTGQTTSGIFVWGAQFEAGAFATSYIPTTTASVTRNADVCSISGANFTSFWNQSEGTLVLDMIKSYTVPVVTTQINHLTASDGTLNNYIQFAQRSAGTTGEVFRCEVGGSNQALFAGGPLNAINTPFRIGGAYKLNDFASAINGSDSSTDTTGATPSTLNQLQFPVVLASNHIRSLQYYSVRKTNTELTRLTRLPTLDPALTLDMQFALDAAYFSRLGPLPTFTNASTTRTFVGSDGLIKIAASNVPRIDFDPVTRLCRGLLIEEQRTNLVSRSEDFADASWTRFNATVVSNSASAPDGSTTADLVYPSATGNLNGEVYKSTTSGISSGNTVTVSCFIKASGKNFAYLAKVQNTTGADWSACYLNLTTGAITNVLAGCTAAVEQYPNGWWRLSLTSTAGAGPYWALVGSSDAAGSQLNTASGTNGILVWGFQMEVGAFATSYIPTTTTSLVRSADVCSITGAAFTGFYNQTEGTLVFKGMKPAVQANGTTYVSVDDNTANERLILYYSTNEFFNVQDGGVAQASIASGVSVAANTRFGMAARYNVNDFALSVSGGAVATDVSGTLPSVTQMTIGSRLSTPMNIWVESIQYYNTIKTNAQLQALSTP